jgi:16S rRNA U1498 N3-methylase RsmE
VFVRRLGLGTVYTLLTAVSFGVASLVGINLERCVAQLTLASFKYHEAFRSAAAQRERAHVVEMERTAAVQNRWQKPLKESAKVGCTSQQQNACTLWA